MLRWALPVSGDRPRWWIEAFFIVWLLWIYDAVSNLAPMREAAAMRHAWEVLHFEQRLHIDPEKALNHWMSLHLGLGWWVSNYYDNAHFVVTLGLVWWLWWRRPEHYRGLRTSLVLINVIGFTVYWLWPMAPPRLLIGGGFVDIVAVTHAFGAWHAGLLKSVANQFAAMPSLHMAWATWCAIVVWRLYGKHRWVATVWLYPAITAVAVMATANHFLTDVVAGVLTAFVATWMANGLQGYLDRRATKKSRGKEAPSCELAAIGNTNTSVATSVTSHPR